jgi:hypothetical protein
MEKNKLSKLSPPKIPNIPYIARSHANNQQFLFLINKRA